MIRKEVRTPRLILRPMQITDHKVWRHCWMNHLKKQNEWDSGPKSSADCTKKQFEKVIARHKVLEEKDDYYWYGVFEKKTGALIGGIDFDIYVRSTHQFANFGYVIYNRYWGQGFGQEASAAGLKIGFTQLKLNRLEAAVNLHNQKSIRLCKAIGMHREGIKKRYWFENGKWTDHLIYVANPEDIGLKANKPF
jgi:[ribosomal protein S5]-alanine N-acetyltransferase